MFGFPISSILIFLPMIGAIFIIGINNKYTSSIKSMALWISFLTLILSFANIFLFSFESEIIRLQDSFDFAQYLFQYETKMDNFSVLFGFTISLLCFLSILWIMKREIIKTKNFFISLLFFETCAIGAFYAHDIFLLFIFMESSIIPMYIMLLSGDSLKKNDYIFQFIVYSIVSAFVVLVAFIMMYLETNTSDLIEIYNIGIKNKTIFYLLALGIGIKMPIWPFYHWLPIVHVKSSTVCSVLLASIILKFSSLLIIRFLDPLFYSTLVEYKDIIFWIIAISVTFAVSQLIFQDDLKSFFSYFSIIHMNLYFIILISGLDNTNFIFSIIQHSIVMAIMFFISDIIKKVFKTRSIYELKNSNIKFFKINSIILFCFLALICAPFTWGFISEIIVIYAVTKISFVYSCIICFLILISSMYAIFVYHFVFGSLKNRQMVSLNDFHITDGYKQSTMFILFSILIIIGISPNLILKFF